MILVNSFRGARPRVSEKRLDDNQARSARNCRLTSGALRPLREPLYVADLAHSGNLKSLYRFGRQHWFSWDTDVDVVRGPIANDTTERTYWTGDGFPKVTDASIATAGGGSAFPNNWYRLGIPVPAGAPQVEIAGDFSGDIEPDNQEFHVWVYTYVSAWNEEGPPSSPSMQLERDRDTDGNFLPVDITMDAAPTGPYNIAFKRIYRRNTGEASADYQLVAEIPVAQTTYRDEVQNDELTNVLLSTFWDAPPEGLQGLLVMPTGFAVGFDGIDLLASEPYQLHAWPREYLQPCDFEIVGLGSFGNTVVVCTEGRPYIATGVDPGGLSLQQVELDQACVSKRSIARMGLEGVVYASPDGLVLIGPGTAAVVTSDMFTREEWQALHPESITAFSHDGAYIAFWDNGQESGCFIIDSDVDGLVVADVSATGGFVDLLTDSLYLIIDGNVYEWDAGNAMTAEWTGKVWTGRATNYPACQVDADEYPESDPVTLEVIADGDTLHTHTVASRQPMRLPAGRRYFDWSLRLQTKVAVHEVRIGPMEAMA